MEDLSRHGCGAPWLRRVQSTGYACNAVRPPSPPPHRAISACSLDRRTKPKAKRARSQGTLREAAKVSRSRRGKKRTIYRDSESYTHRTVKILGRRRVPALRHSIHGRHRIEPGASHVSPGVSTQVTGLTLTLITHSSRRQNSNAARADIQYGCAQRRKVAPRRVSRARHVDRRAWWRRATRRRPILHSTTLLEISPSPPMDPSPSLIPPKSSRGLARRLARRLAPRALHLGVHQKTQRVAVHVTRLREAEDLVLMTA